jgi:hypothetical protein
MASLHLYVRTQVTGSDADLRDLADQVAALQAAVEAAGGEWRGAATLDPDAAPEQLEEREETAVFATRPSTSVFAPPSKVRPKKK